MSEPTAPKKTGDGKKGPTPKRREREAANFRPLVPDDRKQAKKEMQAQMRRKQQEAREGMARGDDRYLRENDRGPQKRYMRDYIDARFSFGELLLPLMFVVIFVTFVPAPEAGIWAMTFIWAYLAIAITEAVIIANLIKRRIRAVVGESKLEKGFIFGTLARIMQLRMLRMPKPQVKRGERIVFTGH
ncbi:hypothetical protein GCM10011490_02230 [Pseudoclavibacter endophyticus]|uniref:DUF3043 domain-containing protein n=1 Tax=Pseudoclavibacter endophyticus TaxID=1778590 RepID=A0A6H9WTI8_9MICO|nr:DUF3043 domain-containing protein [Pseudoclavibacter endophyticus]KAB1650237.1 DUF3043 domain-containing protein [Pseudoclavibacter endophyticus]GGA55953.1 hypothetical protein GCM10011490_02230 [Pseudoclavibacter endophyticus]